MAFSAPGMGGGTSVKRTKLGGRYANRAVGGLSISSANDSEGSFITGSNTTEALMPVIVPASIKIEASNFKTKEEAALGVAATFGAEGVRRTQELQVALIEIAANNWGYLTPGWGPVGATRVDPKGLIDAYSKAGFLSKRAIWMHGHWDNQFDFSATDFPMVWSQDGLFRSTFLVNKNLEVRVLTSKHLQDALSSMRGSVLKNSLIGLQNNYPKGLPGDTVK